MIIIYAVTNYGIWLWTELPTHKRKDARILAMYSHKLKKFREMYRCVNKTTQYRSTSPGAKKTIFLLFLAVCVLVGYWFWLSLRPVEIIGVHENGNHSYVLVKNFPFTDRGKINWWLENKNRLKDKYQIPKPATYGSYTIIFWLFDEGYKEEGKYDRICFNDMPAPVNCIEKNAIFSINKSTNLGTIFTVYDGDNYRVKDGKIIIVKDE